MDHRGVYVIEISELDQAFPTVLASLPTGSLLTLDSRDDFSSWSGEETLACRRRYLPIIGLQRQEPTVLSHHGRGPPAAANDLSSCRLLGEA